MNTKRQARDIALDLLRRSSAKVQMAAVVTDVEERTISWGWNSYTEHAEQAALRRSNPKRIRGSTITVAGRRMKSGNLVFAFPCAQYCLPLLRARGISAVEFHDKGGTWYVAKC